MTPRLAWLHLAISLASISYACFTRHWCSPKSLYMCLNQLNSRAIFFNAASTSPLPLHHSPNPTTCGSSTLYFQASSLPSIVLWSSLKVSHIMDMTRNDSFAAPPGLSKAPVVPARFRRLRPGRAIRGISK